MNRDLLNLLEKPVSMGEYEINVQSEEDAFDTVVDNIGATLPRRDGIDARIVADAKNGTGRIINTIEEVGGFSGIESEQHRFEIPQEWKIADKMGMMGIAILLTADIHG